MSTKVDKSDVKAKDAFIEELRKRGFPDPKKHAAPSDIVAEKDGKTWYFEIKKTSHEDKYFGAATITEWQQALLTPDTFRFVVAISTDSDETFRFIEYTPAEFMEFSSVPPFKIFFNIDFSGKKRKRGSGKRKATAVTADVIQKLCDFFGSIRES